MIPARVFLWLLAAAVATVELGLMIWQLPPRKLEGRVQQATPIAAKPGPVVCPYDPPCCQDGKPLAGERKRYTVCGFAVQCWMVEGVPVRY